MRQYEMCEISFQGEKLTYDWANIDLNATFSCGQIECSVKGFVAEDGIYKIRFLPEVAGVWNYHVMGVINESGVVNVQPSENTNHGKVRAVECHFEYQDGALFVPFGTTVYALIHQPKYLIKETMETLGKAPFNKIRFCIFPKHYDYNHNEPEFFPFEKDENSRWNVRRPCFQFWDALDESILTLHKMGVECDLILFHPYDRWGFSEFSEKEEQVYLDYLLRRLSAMPNVWWSLANEYDLIQGKSIERWNRIEVYLATNDSYHHLIGNHNCFRFWNHSRANITHASLQTKMLSRIPEWRKKYGKPICIDECCYEGNILPQWGSISGKEMTYRFWRTITLGGYCTHGETYYNKEEVLWWSKGGKLIGESPIRIAFLKAIIDELVGPIEPCRGMAEMFLNKTKEELKDKIKMLPKEFASIANAVSEMDKEEMKIFFFAEPIYAGHVGDDAFLVFYDLRTCAKAELQLPDDKKYKLELIDVWNMTRQVIKKEISGRVEFDMPGEEGYAVLAKKINIFH